MRERFQLELSWPEVFVIGKVLVAEAYGLTVSERGVVDGVLERLRDCQLIHSRNQFEDCGGSGGDPLEMF